MKLTKLTQFGIFAVLFSFSIISCKNDIANKSLATEELDQIESTLSPSEKKIKALLESILVAVGNQDVQELDDLSFNQGIIAYTYPTDEQWQHREMTVDSYLQTIRDKKDPEPFLESANSYKIDIAEDRLASVIMPTVISKFGVALTKEINHATMMKEKDQWKLLSIAWTVDKIPEGERVFNLNLFAEGYAQVWGSNRPEFVAMFYGEDGVLAINDGAPAIGRNAITNVAKEFMDAFPDMIVTMDSLVSKTDKTRFYWTLTGTNNGLTGTGNKIEISGFEESKGYFDEKEYKRQLEVGTEK